MQLWLIITLVVGGLLVASAIGVFIYFKLGSNFNQLPNTSLIYDLVGKDKTIINFGEKSNLGECQSACADASQCLGYTWIDRTYAAPWTGICYGVVSKNYTPRQVDHQMSGWKS